MEFLQPNQINLNGTMKITITKAYIIVMLLCIASPAMSMDTIRSKNLTEGLESRAAQLQSRLEAINAIDKHSLSHKEKKELRREVREIKKELAAISGGVYLSVGAIILIALLLILLL